MSGEFVSYIAFLFYLYQVKDFVGKGRGVVATAAFKRGDFVVEYIGDTIELEKAKKREKAYKDNPDFGCYMYYFTYRNKPYW